VVWDRTGRESHAVSEAENGYLASKYVIRELFMPF